MTSENDFEDERDLPEDEPGRSEDELVRALLVTALPDFPTTVALGDRALAGAARRRARARTFGGVGAIAVVAGCVLAVAPLAGWGGHRPGTADVGNAVAAAGTPSTPPAPLPSSPSRSSPTSRPVLPPPSQPSTTLVVQPWTNSPKQQAAERVANALQDGHDNAYMGVLLISDNNPILVYRKPGIDSTLEHDATQAAYPFSVVFRDSVLDASEQWFLGHRMDQDTAYWKSRGVTFGTALENDGTIAIYTSDPGTVVPLLEAHYGYDGKVFVGREWNPTPASVPSSGS
ncbi:hypothetical protein ABH935_003922 [Catenulispora sp. GAS73]|uniref:hypothetical protein n=1 Tax=Catenulispora sp. GAS73 TaxID=3156269 RepID=UPI003513A99F